MRKLQTTDIFKISAIIRKLNLKKELKSLETKDSTQLGVQLFLILFENLDKAEEEILSFFADIGEKTVDEFRQMSLDELAGFIEELQQLEGLGKLLKSLFKTQKAS